MQTLANDIGASTTILCFTHSPELPCSPFIQASLPIHPKRVWQIQIIERIYRHNGPSITSSPPCAASVPSTVPAHCRHKIRVHVQKCGGQEICEWCCGRGARGQGTTGLVEEDVGQSDWFQDCTFLVSSASIPRKGLWHISEESGLCCPICEC